MANQRYSQRRVRAAKQGLIFGLTIATVSIVLMAWPANPVVAKLGWTDHGIVAWALGFLLPSTLLALISGIALYDSKEIPDELVSPLPDLNVQGDEPWRKQTGFRYLEQLKRRYNESEERISYHYKGLVRTRDGLQNSRGYIEYVRYRKHHNGHVVRFNNEVSRLNELEEHIEKVFAGDVHSDVLELEELAEKLKLKKEHLEDELVDTERKISERPKDARELLEMDRSSYRASIKNIELRLVEIASSVKELREFDFQKLYKELGVSQTTMRVDKESLNEIKEKTTIVSQIVPNGRVKTEDDQKIKQAKDRNRHDIQFDTEIRLSRGLHTLEEIQSWRREQRERVLENSVLTASEKEERLDQIERAVESEKRRLNNDAQIFEDE